MMEFENLSDSVNVYVSSYPLIACILKQEALLIVMQLCQFHKHTRKAEVSQDHLISSPFQRNNYFFPSSILKCFVWFNIWCRRNSVHIFSVETIPESEVTPVCVMWVMGSTSEPCNHIRRPRISMLHLAMSIKTSFQASVNLCLLPNRARKIHKKYHRYKKILCNGTKHTSWY